MEDDEFHGRTAIIGPIDLRCEHILKTGIKNFGLLQMLGCPERDAWFGCHDAIINGWLLKCGLAIFVFGQQTIAFVK